MILWVALLTLLWHGTHDQRTHGRKGSRAQNGNSNGHATTVATKSTKTAERSAAAAKKGLTRERAAQMKAMARRERFYAGQRASGTASHAARKTHTYTAGGRSTSMQRIEHGSRPATTKASMASRRAAVNHIFRSARRTAPATQRLPRRRTRTTGR